jgi:hypothetical protein
MILTREQTSLLASLHGKRHMPPFEAADVYFIVDAGLAILRPVTSPAEGGGYLAWSLTEKGKRVLAENEAYQQSAHAGTPVAASDQRQKCPESNNSEQVSSPACPRKRF